MRYEWPLIPLKDIGTIARGKSRHRPRYDPILYGGKYPFIQTGEVKGAYRYIDKYEQTYSDIGLAQSKLWPKGTVCITIAANIAESAILNIDACFPDSVVGFTANEGVCERLYVYYFLQNYKQSIQNMAYGTVQENINLSTFDKVMVPLPPLDTQKEIVSILGTLDDKIELNLRMNETLEQMAMALYKHWFVDFGPFQDWEFEESELGSIPKGWSTSRLGDVADINAQSITKKNAPPVIEYIDIASVEEGKLLGTTPYDFSEAPSRARRLVRSGDIIWSTVRPNRKSYLYIDFAKENTVASTGFAVISAKTVPSTYLYSYVTTEEFVSYLVANADGSAYPAVRADKFEEAPILLPPTEVLQQYHLQVSAMREQIRLNNSETMSLTDLRNYLLPRLLSGEIDLSAAEKQIEEVI